MAGASIHGASHRPAMSKHPDNVTLPPIQPRWNDCRTVVVSAPGPSLTQEVADRCRNLTVLAIKEAYQLLPWAEVLYGCDQKFWVRRNGCPDFQGEKWSSHDNGSNHKLAAARDYGLKLVNGRGGLKFSLDPNRIHYGSNSGFQAINLAILFGATKIILVGFDMRTVNGTPYFFGKHPAGTAPGYASFIEKFNIAARHLPPTIHIINATPDSALYAFPRMSLDDAIALCSRP